MRELLLGAQRLARRRTCESMPRCEESRRRHSAVAAGAAIAVGEAVGTDSSGGVSPMDGAGRLPVEEWRRSRWSLCIPLFVRL